MEDKGAEGHSKQEIIKETKTERRKTKCVLFCNLQFLAP
jgi:hypothetical protein